MSLQEEILSVKHEVWNIDKLIPYDRNPRKNDHLVDEMASKIKEFGLPIPLCIRPDGLIVDGHLRYKALKKLGIEQIPVAVNDTWTQAQVKAFRLSANKMAEKAEWDMGYLALELEELEGFDYDLSLTGFDEDELSKIINPTIVNEGFSDPDDVPELKNNSITKIGDVWILGNHRIMCGDSTNPLDVDKLLNNFNPNIMITDPPYGVNYDPEWRDGADLGIGERSKGKVKNDDKFDWTDSYSLFNGDIVYIWHAGKYTHLVAKNLEDCNFEIISQIIWAKQHFVLSRGDYHWKHEPCWYAVRKGKNHNWQGARDQSTIWNIKNNNSFGNSDKEETWGHGTQKPLDCMLIPILNNTKTCDLVYDPFGGSGTTLIACEKTNRNCLMMELDSNYCDVIIKRWQKFTEKQATLESNNKTFNELQALL